MKELTRIALVTVACFAIATACAQSRHVHRVFPLGAIGPASMAPFQFQDEVPGSVTVYQVLSTACSGTGGTAQHLYPEVVCYINIGVNGNAIGYIPLNLGWGGYTPAPYGQVDFHNIGDLSGLFANNTVVSSSWSIDTSTLTYAKGFPYNGAVCNNNCSQLTVNITGITPDDGGSITATLVLNAYFYFGCSGGRGGCHSVMLVLPSHLGADGKPDDGTGLYVKYN
jgi:hypothetical protein